MTVIAYHFTGDKLRDGRPVPPIGETLVHDGEIVWCQSGLYASRRPSQALEIAPGNLLHMVECDGIEFEDAEKFACRRRTILKTIDAEQMVRRYAADHMARIAENTALGGAWDAAWTAKWVAARDARAAMMADFDARVARLFEETA